MEVLVKNRENEEVERRAKQISVLGREWTHVISIYERHRDVNEIALVVPEGVEIDDAIVEVTAYLDKIGVRWRIVRAPSNDIWKCVETMAPEFLGKPVILDIADGPRSLGLCSLTAAILTMQLRNARVMAVYTQDENGRLAAMDLRPLAVGPALRKLKRGEYGKIFAKKLEKYGLFQNGQPTNAALVIDKILRI